jgi:hypothetical protein
MNSKGYICLLKVAQKHNLLVYRFMASPSSEAHYRFISCLRMKKQKLNEEVEQQPLESRFSLRKESFRLLLLELCRI